MDTVWVAFVQLVFVTIVYCVAYRTGYKTAHDKAVTIVQECSGPMHELLDRLSCAGEQMSEDEADED